MSVLDKPDKKHEWRLTIGNSKVLRATFGSCRTTAVGQLDKIIQQAAKLYKEDYDALCVVRNDLAKTAMTDGRQEWTFTIGGTSGRIIIEKLESK